MRSGYNNPVMHHHEGMVGVYRHHRGIHGSNGPTHHHAHFLPGNFMRPSVGFGGRQDRRIVDHQRMPLPSPSSPPPQQQSQDPTTTTTTTTTPIVIPNYHGPLSASALASASPEMQKDMIGERLYHQIYKSKPYLAGRITGILLELDNCYELLNLLESPDDALKDKVDEVLEVIEAHRTGAASIEYTD